MPACVYACSNISLILKNFISHVIIYNVFSLLIFENSYINDYFYQFSNLTFNCSSKYFSVSFDTDKLILKWGFEGVIVNPELKLLQYNLDQPLKINESVSFINEKNGALVTILLDILIEFFFKCSGNFSRLTVLFQFERQFGHHLIQTFAPSTLVVMLSWFSFWLGLDAIPGRVTLLVTCMLTLVTMFTGLKSDIPPIAYVKVI